MPRRLQAEKVLGYKFSPNKLESIDCGPIMKNLTAVLLLLLSYEVVAEGWDWQYSPELNLRGTAFNDDFELFHDEALTADTEQINEFGQVKMLSRPGRVRVRRMLESSYIRPHHFCDKVSVIPGVLVGRPNTNNNGIKIYFRCADGSQRHLKQYADFGVAGTVEGYQYIVRISWLKHPDNGVWED